MKLNKIEEEIIFLSAIKDMIDSMVNLEILLLLGTDPDSNVMFASATHKLFFNIVLVDFLSVTDDGAHMQRASYLGALRSISENPHFNVCNSLESLRSATQEFINWLEQKVEVDVWLPLVDKQTPIKISRIDFLKMSGNISKHNFLRSVRVARLLKEILEESGTPIEMQDALLSLKDFHHRFHTDILGYHASTIADFLNNIRWGIFDYLQPEFHRSIVYDKDNPTVYRYTYPEGVSTKLAQECYWELMNEVRHKPKVRRFHVTRWLKLRY